MAGMREVKSVEELVFMQKAIDATSLGFKEMMRCIKPGMTEFQAQAIVEYFMKKGGCEYQGYPSIGGSGRNSCVLHYTFNRKVMADGELFLSDMGGEYHGYSADITRTIPVSGKFSEEQKQIYNLVLEAQTAGIRACKKGASFHDPHITAKKIIADGLMKLGIIKTEEEVTTYFMHGASHYLGLDVHDAGLYQPLQEGNVITVEPGIYIPEGAACDRKWWNIGVRIEDDVLITDGKPTVLSEAIPRSVWEIEKLMKEDGIFK
jgi:Xaa-Pro aminopeptidase